LNFRDHTADTPKEAVRQAVMAGIDMSMVPFDYSFYNLTLECIKDGSIPRSRIDDAVRRILRVKYSLGLFTGRNAWPDSSALDTFNKPEYDEANLRAAHQGITLLKNTGNVLPLDNNRITATNKLVITGPTSNVLTSLNGGWSYTWQGNDQSVYPANLTNKTILESLRTRLGSAKLDYYNSSTFNQLFNIDDLLNAAQTASYIIVCLGEQSYTETPGNIDDLTLDEAQLQLVERIRNRTQVPIITVLVQGRPRIIRRIVDLSSAIVMAYLPGMEGYVQLYCLCFLFEIVFFSSNRGRALGDILFGDYNPSGRLPITYPKYNQHMSTYDYKWSEIEVGNTIDVEFEFGSGLSYTTFEYTNLNVPLTMNWNDQITITLNVKNTGARQGDHSVLLYISDWYRSVTPPNKELKGFTKLSFAANDQKQVQFTLSRNDLSFIGIDLTRQTEPGLFVVTVGNLKANFTLIAGDEPPTSTTTTTASSKSNHQQYSIASIVLLLFIASKLI
jgi:beta-glucosidase